MQRHTDVLDGIEKEQVTKSYKLVTLQALLQLGALRTGADVAEIAWTAHQIVTGDPRLLADTSSAEMPDPASVDADTWREYWLNWPLSAWAGRLRGSIQRLVPHRLAAGSSRRSRCRRCRRNLRRHGGGAS